jgi:hypothetical protein
MRRNTAFSSAVLIALSLGSAALAGCGTLKYDMQSSAVAPGADAHLVADVKKWQGQTMLEIKAENLMPPERIQAGTTQYIGWYRPNAQGAWNRIGTLEYDEDKRKGRLAGSVPETAFDLQISAEPAVLPTSPSPQILFSQRVEDD